MSLDVVRRVPSDRRLPNPPAAIVPRRTALVGPTVRIEPLDTEKHGQQLYDASHETSTARAVWDYLTCGPYSDVDTYKSALRTQSIAADPIYYAICNRETSRACGQCSFLDIDAANGSIEIGHIWFGPDLRQTRSGTEALFVMMSHAFDALKYRRLQWRCNALNERSKSAAIRLGFTLEGIFYNHLYAKGRNRDTAWFSIMEEEWPDRRRIIEAWLSNDNFGESGTPRTSLSHAMRGRAAAHAT